MDIQKDIQKLRTENKDLLEIEKLLNEISNESSITSEIPVAIRKKLWNIGHLAELAESRLFDYCCNFNSVKKEEFKWYEEHFNSIKEMCEFLNKHGLKPNDFHYGMSNIGTPYSILYFSNKKLW